VLEKSLVASDCESALTLLLNVVHEYHPQGSIEDLTWKEKRRRKDQDHVVSLKDFRDKHKNEIPDSANLKKPS
jgi:phosphodiesterase/alkaline phosphatase D-like protein